MEFRERHIVVVLAEVLQHELVGLEGQAGAEGVPAPALVVRNHVVAQIPRESNKL
jgi:hypothetical protein